MTPWVILVPLLAAVLGVWVLPSVAAIGGALACAVLAVLVAAGPATETGTPLTPTGTVPITVGVRVTELSAQVAVMVAVVALAIQVYSVGYVRQRYRSYAALVSLFTAAMLTVVLSADLIMTYAGWEVMGICSYLLIGHRWEQPASTAAAVKSFLMTRFGDVGFLFGIFVLGTAAGSFRVTDVLAAVPAMSDGTLLAASLLVLLGVVGKSAQFPLHSWLPDAMAGPAPVSALIHAATMVAAGVYLVALLFPVFLAAPLALDVLAVLAVITMIGAALAALTTEDLKRVLAYSTISQLGLMFAALAVGGRTEAVDHLLSHAAFKALLFLGAGAVIVAVGSTAMARMGGLRRSMPITFATMTVGFAALAGLPPTSGFVSKDGILTAADQAATGTAIMMVVAVLVTSALTAAYATRAWLLTFFGAGPAVVEVRPVLWWPLVVLAAPALLFGLLLPRPPLAAAILSSAAALTGVGLAFLGWRTGRLTRSWPLLATAWHTDDLYERTVARFVLRLSDVVLGVDDRVVARAVSGAGRSAGRVGGVVRRTQNGNPQWYLTGLFAGVLLIVVGVVVLS